ncbi:MAG: CpXC domain-containing protein [Anaerolineales bacterium]
MPKVQAHCPNCQQPIAVEVTQVVDVGKDPQMKQRLLSGSMNTIQCPHCGFQGQLPTPLVYHDPDKELLLTYNPPEAGLSMEERERKMAPLLKKVTQELPPEERKGYLFQPQTMMSMDSLVKRVLKEDGITEEDIEDQEKKVRLLQKLLSRDGKELNELIQENEDMIDREFFMIFSQIAQRLIATQNEDNVKKIQELQESLLDRTEIGRQIRKESEELEKARNDLERIGQNLTRNTLLEMIEKAPNEERVKALASLARPAMDYQFFQMFSEKIEQMEGEERKSLIEKRNVLLKITKEIDQQVEERMSQAKEILATIIKADSVTKAVMENISYIDDFFIQAISSEIELAKKKNDEDRLERLQEVLSAIDEISTPAEFKLIDELLEAADDDEKLKQKISQHSEEMTEELLNNLTNILNQVEERKEHLTGKDKEKQEDVLERLEKVHQKVLKASMEKKFQAD